MSRKPPSFLAPDRVRQRALDLLRAAGGSLTRDRLRVGIRTNLSAALLDQAVNELVREGLIETDEETSVYQGIQGDRATYPVRVYRLTPEGRHRAEKLTTGDKQG